MLSVVHSTDAGVDDYAVTAVLQAAANRGDFNFSATVITNADCEPVSALSAYKKTMEYFNSNTPVELSDSRVWTNFPWMWKEQTTEVDKIPCINEKPTPTFSHQHKGDELLEKVFEQTEKVTIVATGPLTTISDFFKRKPDFKQKVDSLDWMGGAVDVPGNLEESPELPSRVLNNKAEWNAYADPWAVDTIFRNTDFPIHLYPVDISNGTFPNDFMKTLKQKEQTKFTRYIDECYEIVQQIEEYRMWDVVAAAGVIDRAIFEEPEKRRLSVMLDPKNEGAIVDNTSAEREVFVYKRFKDDNVNLFYDLIADTLTVKDNK